MIHKDVDVAVIGGGPAGLGAAVSAKRHGAKQVLVIDRNSWLGGILPQCIHDGFGVEELGMSLTGPEYAEHYIELGTKEDVDFLTETMVLRFTKKREVVAVNTNGIFLIRAKALIIATGCREKTRWNACIPGTRPSGIYSAGVAQAFINLYNIMPGRNIVVLGSGDVGLIMARRLTFEGAKVAGVVEMLPYASGLPRNIVQCLDDYGIPLFLNHTVTSIDGKDRVEQVTIQQVDDTMALIPGTERQIRCDTLLLALGLIPENELSGSVGIDIDSRTGGPVVTDQLETSVPGVFACGNCLQVYDTVDLLALDAKKAGCSAAEHVTQKQARTDKKPFHNNITVCAGKNVRYVVPQQIKNAGKIHFTLRAQKPMQNTILKVVSDNKELLKKKLLGVNPVCMISFDVVLTQDMISSGQRIEVTLNEQ